MKPSNAGFLFGTSDTQKQQRIAIKAALDGKTPNWFAEPEAQNKLHYDERTTLHKALRFCRTENATFCIASLKGFMNTEHEALTHLNIECDMHGYNLAVADDPTITKGSVKLISAAADIQRERIAAKSKAAVASIRKKLERGETHISKSGRTITRLGPKETQSASAIGQAANARLAQNRDDEVWPVINQCIERGMGLTATARHLNEIGIRTPADRAHHNRTTKGSWYASTVKNIIKRREKNGGQA